MRSPYERLAIFLYSLRDDNPFWKTIGKHYNKQVCFRDYMLEEILEDKNIAKQWFKDQEKKYWRR